MASLPKCQHWPRYVWSVGLIRGTCLRPRKARAILLTKLDLRSGFGLSLRLVFPVLQKCRELPSLLDMLTEFGLISDGLDGLYISFGRLSQCTRVLKVSVLETGHTRYSSISGSNPLRQSSVLTWHCRWTPTSIHHVSTVANFFN